LAAPVSFHQDLINQLNTFILNDDGEILLVLVGSIDDMGYIHRSVPDIVDDMAFTRDYTDDVTVKEC
jgi:RNA polymerase sigma-54 factor